MPIAAARVAWSIPSGRLAVADFRRAKVYDTTDLANLSENEFQERLRSTSKLTLPRWGNIEHPSDISAVTISEDGNFLALGGTDGTLAVWQISEEANPVPVALDGSPSYAISSAAFGLAGRLIAVAAANQVHLYSLS